MAFNEHSNLIGEVGTARGWSLALAVVHHGLSCLSKNSIPAKSHTVIETAKHFETYLSTGNNYSVHNAKR